MPLSIGTKKEDAAIFNLLHMSLGDQDRIKISECVCMLGMGNHLPIPSISTFAHVHRVVQDTFPTLKELPVMWEMQTQMDECGYLFIHSTYIV